MDTLFVKTATASMLMCFSTISFGMVVPVTTVPSQQLCGYLKPIENRAMRMTCKEFLNTIPVISCLESTGKTMKAADRNRLLLKAIITHDSRWTTMLLQKNDFKKTTLNHTFSAPYLLEKKGISQGALAVHKSCVLDPYSCADQEMKQLLSSYGCPGVDEHYGVSCSPTQLLLASIAGDNKNVKRIVSDISLLQKNIEQDREAIRHSLLVAIQDNNSELIKVFFGAPAICQQIKDGVGIDFYINFAQHNKCMKAVNILREQKGIDALLLYGKNMCSYAHKNQASLDDEDEGEVVGFAESVGNTMSAYTNSLGEYTNNTIFFASGYVGNSFVSLKNTFWG